MKSFTGTAQTRGRGAEELRHLLHRAFAANAALTILGGAMLITFLATLVGLFVDHRVITGAPAWLKPAKFAISVSVYCFTFVWLFGFVENRPRLVRLAANVTVASFIVEMIVIIGQAARGTTSHFNLTTPFNSSLWFTVGGDLRVAHFVGLHALQILPFLGWLLTRRKSVFALLAANDRRALVWTGGLGYLGLVVLLTWQALRGQSVVNPDAKTIAAASVVAASLAASTLITVARVLIRNRKTRVLASAIQILIHQEDV